MSSLSLQNQIRKLKYIFSGTVSYDLSLVMVIKISGLFLFWERKKYDILSILQKVLYTMQQYVDYYRDLPPNVLA